MKTEPISGNYEKQIPFQVDLHYAAPDAHKKRTVFGKPSEDLFYNYSDRLPHDQYTEGAKKAIEQGISPDTAAYFEAILSHIHKTLTVDLRHVVLGCNMSNGYSYLIFGYTYESNPEVEGL